LIEAAKLLGLKASTLQEVINSFASIQTELQKTDETVNTPQVLEELMEYRQKLVSLDVRAAEVWQIVTAYSRLEEEAAAKSPPAATAAADQG
jgi:hypothetical protein